MLAGLMSKPAIPSLYLNHWKYMCTCSAFAPFRPDLCLKTLGIITFLEYLCPPFRTCLSVTTIASWKTGHLYILNTCKFLCFCQITPHGRVGTYFVIARGSGLVQRSFAFCPFEIGGNVRLHARNWDFRRDFHERFQYQSSVAEVCAGLEWCLSGSNKISRCWLHKVWYA